MAPRLYQGLPCSLHQNDVLGQCQRSHAPLPFAAWSQRSLLCASVLQQAIAGLNVYEPHAHWVSNGKDQIQGVDCEQSRSPVACLGSICMRLAVAAQQEMKGHIIDIVNAFQPRA